MLIHFLQRCGISRLPCLRLLNHPQRNMAIPVRVSIQILLVIFLCRIEAVQRLAFHDNGLVKPGLQLLQRTPGNSQIRVIHGINARPILRARVKPLFVERSRINDVVKQLVAARTPCHAARVSCHISKSAEYAKSRPFYATSGFLIHAVFYAVSGFGLSIISTFPSAR